MWKLPKQNPTKLSVSDKLAIAIKFVKRSACQILLKAFDLLSATAWAAPEMLEALAILLAVTVKRCTMKREDLMPYW